MNWTVIIAEIIRLFGPALVALINKWLEGLLKDAEKSLKDPAVYGSFMDQNWAIFSKAIELHDKDGDGLWFWQKLPWSQHSRRRRLLVRLRQSSGQSFLTMNDELEIRGLSEAAT